METHWSPPGRRLFWRRQVRCGEGSDVSLQLFLVGGPARTNGGPRARTRSRAPWNFPSSLVHDLAPSSLPAGRGGTVSSEGEGK